MTPRDAAFNVVNDYAGGVDELARRLAKKPGTLSHEVNPESQVSAKLGYLDAIKISAFTGDHRMLHAFAQVLGYRCVRLNGITINGPKELTQAMSAFAKETGEALIAMHQAIEDGRITENEIRAFQKQVADIAPASMSLVECMREQAEEQARQRALGDRGVT